MIDSCNIACSDKMFVHPVTSLNLSVDGPSFGRMYAQLASERSFPYFREGCHAYISLFPRQEGKEHLTGTKGRQFAAEDLSQRTGYGEGIKTPGWWKNRKTGCVVCLWVASRVGLISQGSRGRRTAVLMMIDRRLSDFQGCTRAFVFLSYLFQS